MAASVHVSGAGSPARRVCQKPQIQVLVVLESTEAPKRHEVQVMKFSKVMRSWQSQGSNAQGRNGWSRKLGSWLGKLGEEDGGDRIQRCGMCEVVTANGYKA